MQLSLLTGFIAAVLPSVLKKTSDPGDIARQVSEQLLRDPRFKNEVNAEPLPQSRVVQGSGLGLTGSLFIVIQQVSGLSPLEYQWEILGPALTILLGTAWSLYGRIAGGLLPAFGGFFRMFRKR